MINLLPPSYAMRIRFGRRNTVLRRWILGALAAIVGLIIILAGGWLYLNQQSSDLQQNLNSTNAQLQAQDLAKVKTDASAITGDITAIDRVLGSEVRFSDLIQDVGRIMPPGTVLSSLSLTQISGTIDLSANAVNSVDAAQISANLNDPGNGLFTKVDIVNINCNQALTTTYKCSATFKALFSASAQKKYINVPGSAK